MAGIAKAEFVGPTNAQLTEQTSQDFNRTMLGMADFFANMQKIKEVAANAKMLAQREQDKQDVTNTQTVLDTMVKNSATGSIAEVAKTAEGQQVMASLYAKMGIPKDVVPAVIGQLANNPYTADQTHQAIMSQFTAEQVAAAQGEAGGGGQATPTQVASSPQPNIPGATNMGTSAPAPVQAQASAMPVQGQATATPAEVVSTPAPAKPAATPLPPYMQEALGPEQAPAKTSTPVSLPEQRKADVQAKQDVRSDAQAQAKTIAQDAGPSAAAIFLRKQLDPNGVEFLAKYAEKNPSEYYKDLDPKHMESFQANIDKTLAERRKLGLEGDEISINLQTLSEKNKTGITYTKALTLQALMAASTAQVNAKLASVSYQMNNAVLNQFLASAKDREDEANKMYTAVTAKGAKATVSDVAHLNSLVEQANSYYKQANRVITTMHVTLGGNPKESPQFADVPSYVMAKDGGLVGGFSNMLTTAMQGEGAATGQVGREGVTTPAQPSGPAAGVGAPQARGTATGAGSRVANPSGFTPAQQAMADDILKSLGQ